MGIFQFAMLNYQRVNAIEKKYHQWVYRMNHNSIHPASTASSRATDDAPPSVPTFPVGEYLGRSTRRERESGVEIGKSSANIRISLETCGFHVEKLDFTWNMI